MAVCTVLVAETLRTAIFLDMYAPKANLVRTCKITIS